MHWIVTQKVFDMFIMLVIVLSSIALALEDPVAEDENQILKSADYVFTAMFAMECGLKVVELIRGLTVSSKMSVYCPCLEGVQWLKQTAVKTVQPQTVNQD